MAAQVERRGGIMSSLTYARDRPKKRARSIANAMGTILILVQVFFHREGWAAEPQQDSGASECLKAYAQVGANPADAPLLTDVCQFAVPTIRVVDPDAVERGHALYTSHGCAFCHGKDIRGGEGGPSLLLSTRVNLDLKGETIGEVILNGVPKTAMAAFPLKPNELSDIAEFLHSFPVRSDDLTRHSLPSIVTGDVKAGRKYFDGRCAGCHSRGGEFWRIGAKYADPKVLQQIWLMPKPHALVTVTVNAADGSTVEGHLLRIDEFSLTVGLTDGTQRTLERTGSEPKLVIHDPLAGHRSLLPTYTDKSIHDLTAYLVTLKGPPQRAPKGTVPNSPETTQNQTSNLGLSPEAILHPEPGSWPTYSGDYSARRFSPLKQIDQTNIRQLALAWSTRLSAGPHDNGSHPLIIKGEGKGDLFVSRADIRASILEVNGILYVSTPDNAWAVDARDGHVNWHFNWKTRGGSHFGNRGLGMWSHYLYMETPDNYLISIDALTGDERWHVEMASLEQDYSASQAPVVVRNHVLVGIGGSEKPGSLQSFDPDTGKLQWIHYSVPKNLDDPGLETWKDLNAAQLGAGGVWIPGAYDPETNFYIYGTGNPEPAAIAERRGNGDALFTCSILAVDVENGKMAWYYQTSPNDTNDWDAAQTPILADITLNGRPRKVAMTAARNGYFFVVDRITGEHLLTSKFLSTANWAEPKLNAKGQPVRVAEKDHLVSGALISPNYVGAANWVPASYSPDFGLLYVSTAASWAMHYKVPIEAGGKLELIVDADSYLEAIDPKTGKIAWSVQYPSREMSYNGLYTNGILTTAGKLLFSGDFGGNLVARDPATGTPLWHTHLGGVSNAPETYMLDGHQYVLVAAGDMLYAFKVEI